MEIYHVLNRGVEKRDLVMDEQDRNRFVRDLYEMNNVSPVTGLWYRASSPFWDVGRRKIDKREQLVVIHGWCLMNNHYHLLVSENRGGGLSLFLKKLNGGYAKYFNERYDRTGTLFQGRTKKILIEHDAHFLWILHYIHFNPLDYFKEVGDWRTQCLVNSGRAIEWLNMYPWSSWNDYRGEGMFSPILQGSFMFKDRKEHVAEAKRVLRSFRKSPILLDTFE